MPKIVGTRERVHQPFYDSLLRVDGSKDLRTQNDGVFGPVQSRSQLFTKTGADLAISNLTTGGFFPSDQTFVTLAVRVWTYFRFNAEALYTSAPGEQSPITAVPGTWADRVMRVHKLYHQSENQLFWQLQAGDKPQLTTFTAYTPFAGGLDGFFGGGGGGGASSGAVADPYLGTAANFTVLAGSTITSSGPTVIHGNLGLSPGSAVVGFPPGTVTGVQHVTDAASVQAKTDLTAAIVALSLLPPDTSQGPGNIDIGGTVITPGVHAYASSVGITGVVTLNGPGLYVFQIGSTLTAAVGSSVVLTNGASAANIYWVVGSSATLNTGAVFNGNILADQSISLGTGATVVGRLLASVAAVTLLSNDISLSPDDPVAAAYDYPSLYRANNGLPTSSALMRLARPVLIPPRQGFQVICQASPMGPTVGASLVEQLNGLVPNNTANAFITGAPSTGIGAGTGLSVPGMDTIEKDVKYLIDGIHSRDVL